MGGCMGQWVGSGQMTNLIKLELINIIWFCLKIYNLSRHPYLWVDGWINGWAHVKPLKSNKSWPNWDNSIMDILDILLDILLKPPQPFIGLFFCLENRVDFYHTFCPGNHRDGNEYLSTQSISNFKKLHSLKKNTVNVFWQLFVLTAICFGTGAAPGVLYNVAVLCSGCC